MSDYESRYFWQNSLNLKTDKLLKEAHDLINNKQIGFASKIEVPIQDVGEYELVLVLSNYILIKP